MSLPFQNKYHLRRVAESSSRACGICYKPTTAVLVTADGKTDFFYVCDVHLTDASFATAEVDPKVEAAKKRLGELDQEIENVKRLWQEYQKKKKNKKSGDESKSDAKKGENNPDADKESTAAADLDKLEKTKDEDQKIIATKPRVFVLNRDMFNVRLGHWRSVQKSKQAQQLLQKPNLFPKPPTSLPSKTPPPIDPPPSGTPPPSS